MAVKIPPQSQNFLFVGQGGKMTRHIQKLIILILTILLTACLSIADDESEEQLQGDLKGQILMWHTWEGEERGELKEILAGFTEMYPDVTIAEEAYPLEDIEDTFSYEVQAGLGPDILIAPANLTE